MKIPNYTTLTATRMATFALPVEPPVVPGVVGRRTPAGVTAAVCGTSVPAFGKDAVPGVRAWSPPV
ncbi:MAG: hypothetical protein ACR2KG_06130 [Nocardioidaceae bacterium]